MTLGAADQFSGGEECDEPWHRPITGEYGRDDQLARGRRLQPEPILLAQSTRQPQNFQSHRPRSDRLVRREGAGDGQADPRSKRLGRRDVSRGRLRNRPDCIILGGESSPTRLEGLSDAVEKIPVGRKAGVLYFLHAAHVHRPITDREREQMLDRGRPFVPPALLTYVLHYADGQTAEIPAVLEGDIDHWIQEKPRPLAAGRIGWSAPLADDSGRRMVVYSMQAANPRPDVEIESIDVRRTSTRANPAVLAVTLGDVLTQ